MKDIITLIENATGIKPVPFETRSVEEDAVVYQLYQISEIQWRLEVRVISHTYTDANEIAEKIVSCLTDFGDYQFINTVTSISINGGGILKDYETNTIHRLLYFNVYQKKLKPYKGE